MSDAYKSLEERFHRLGVLGEVAGMLHWDLSVMMPEGSYPARAEQLSTLAVMRQEVLSEAVLADLLSAAEAEPARLTEWQAANLREMRRLWKHANALDAKLVAALSKASHACEARWREARPQADFALVLPELKALVALVREAAERKAAAFGVSPYEAMMDEFSPGMSEARVMALFDELAATVPGIVVAALERQARAPAPQAPAGPFPKAQQEALGRAVMQRLGFDFTQGRLDQSLHPFSGGTPDDLRITTRYDEADFTSALMGVVHETGHALYEQGLPKDWRRQPVGEARGMDLHESQSLLMEMQAGRSRAFLTVLAPLAAELLGGSGPDWSADNLATLYHRVTPSYIRVEADEVTYPLHVILRTRIERAVIAGELAVEDLPVAWNEGMKELLGLVPPDDRLGCLQDIHWYDGAWGYFPSYTLGAMIAAQLFQAVQQAIPDLTEQLARGDFAPLIAWLRSNIHEQGSRLGSEELVAAASGQPLDPAIYEAHLRRRYVEGSSH